MDKTFWTYRKSRPTLLAGEHNIITACPKSLAYFNKVSFQIKIDKPSWTYIELSPALLAGEQNISTVWPRNLVYF